MNFIARVFRFLFWLLVVSWSVALLKKLVAWMVQGAAQRAESASTIRRFRGRKARLGHRGGWCVIRFAGRTSLRFWRFRYARVGSCFIFALFSAAISIC